MNPTLSNLRLLSLPIRLIGFALFCMTTAISCQNTNKSKDEPDTRNFDISDTTLRAKKQKSQDNIQDTLIKRPEKYKEIDVFRQGLAKVRLNDLYGYIDRDSFEIIKPQYEEATRFQDSLAKVRKGKKFGLINTAGKVVIPFEYEQLGQMKEDIIAIQKGKLYGFLIKKDTTIKELVAPRYEWAGNFMEKRAKVMLKGKWGFLDEKGKEITSLQYDAVRDFREGLAAVWIGYQWGYINQQGKMVISPQFEQALDFDKGKAQVTRNGKTFYINTQGKETPK